MFLYASDGNLFSAQIEAKICGSLVQSHWGYSFDFIVFGRLLYAYWISVKTPENRRANLCNSLLILLGEVLKQCFSLKYRLLNLMKNRNRVKVYIENWLAFTASSCFVIKTLLNRLRQMLAFVNKIKSIKIDMIRYRTFYRITRSIRLTSFFSATSRMKKPRLALRAL